jgi:hypothetical protein
VELRRLPQLRERRRGYFSRGSRAFLHFHEDAGDLYVDVRLDGEFQRMGVTSRDEQADFLSQVRMALRSARHAGEHAGLVGTPFWRTITPSRLAALIMAIRETSAAIWSSS